MALSICKESHSSPGRQQGASPSTNKYYVLILFDISDPKKGRQLVKLLKGYGTRIQKSVFEAQITKSQVKDLITHIRNLMSSKNHFNPNDNVRIYEVAGHCNLTVFGDYNEWILEENIFI